MILAFIDMLFQQENDWPSGSAAYPFPRWGQGKVMAERQTGAHTYGRLRGAGCLQ
jgi:hypothetical protein